jgi:hypothetical protein
VHCARIFFFSKKKTVASFDMKRTYDGAFPSIPVERREGRSTLELLIAAGQTDVLYHCATFLNASRDLYALVRTCKALRDAAYEVLKRGSAYIIPYNISLKNGGATLRAGRLTVYSWTYPPREVVDRILEQWWPSPPIQECTPQVGPPIEIDQADPNSRSWWAAMGSLPLLPIDMARGLAKEKKRREFDTLAREAGLLPARPSYRLVLPPEPWH